MQENQDIEYKESWRDEYLKWICGFANANGGKIFIGKNDNGKVVGITGAKKLLEDIPNKTKDILGVIVDVKLHTENGKEYLEIIVEDYPYPVNYKGQYHYRSGSTKQELKGAAILLFHPKPESFVTGAYIKIGFFESDSELIFQDEIHGNLFEQVEKNN